jgi:hemolysin III
MEQQRPSRLVSLSSDRMAAVDDAIDNAIAVVKPKLRGWLHAATTPLALAAGIVLIALAPTAPSRASAAVFAVTAFLLFGTSAVYHRGTWSPKVRMLLKRLDHSNIFLIIAGTYTPFAILLLPRNEARTLLLVIWGGAIGGMLFRIFWVSAPRWLYTPIYVALGWVAVIYLPDFLNRGGVAVLVLIIVGGALYSLGALVYGLKRPDPSPRWFGFHEIFHTCTVVAFVVHYIAVSLAVYSAPVA